jgi:hypothetical protein
MPDSDRLDESAQARAREVEMRGEALAERLDRLRAGEPVTAADVEHALLAAVESEKRSLEAHARAAVAHHHAAEAHLAAARLADQVGEGTRAEQHRAAAAAEEAAARLDEVAARPRPTGVPRE